MTKPFLVVNVVEGKLGVIRQRPTWDDAVSLAVQMAAEQVDTPEDDIRVEIEADGSFMSNDGTIEVVIAQAEN